MHSLHFSDLPISMALLYLFQERLQRQAEEQAAEQEAEQQRAAMYPVSPDPGGYCKHFGILDFTDFPREETLEPKLD